MTLPYPNFLGSCITTIFKLVIAGVKCKGLHNISACAKELTMELSYCVENKIKGSDSVSQNFTGSLNFTGPLPPLSWEEEERDPGNEVYICHATSVRRFSRFDKRLSLRSFDF